MLGDLSDKIFKVAWWPNRFFVKPTKQELLPQNSKSQFILHNELCTICQSKVITRTKKSVRKNYMNPVAVATVLAIVLGHPSKKRVNA